MHTIGILQLTQNLDDTVRGFKTGLTEAGVAADFFYVNADGNTAQLPKLAQDLAAKNVDLIFACTTPAAKAAIELPGNIPVVFTPVFDPVSAGLVQSMEKPGGKATGVAGMVKAADKVAFIKELLPVAANVGVLYHQADPNALIEVKNFQKASETQFNLIDIPVKNPEDLSILEEILPPDIQALFIPIGKIVEENFASVVYYTDAVQLPVIASHAPNVPAGALGALVANHHSLGRECGKIAAKIFAGTNPGSIPVGVVEQPEIILNAFAASTLDIAIPSTLLEKAQEVYE